MLDRDARAIHLVFKTHLDIAFTDHASRVHRQHYERFIPQALVTGEDSFRECPERPMFTWTTGAQLIWDNPEIRPATGVAPAVAHRHPGATDGPATLEAYAALLGPRREAFRVVELRALHPAEAGVRRSIWRGYADGAMGDRGSASVSRSRSPIAVRWEAYAAGVA